MTLETSVNESIIGDFLNFNRNIAEIPSRISVPHEVKMDTCEYDVVYEKTVSECYITNLLHQSKLKHL